MKSRTCLGKVFLFAALLASIFISKFSFAQPTFFGASSTPADNGAQAGPTVAVTPPAGMLANDLVVIYAEYRGNVAPMMSVGGGQTWNTSVNYSPVATQDITVFWCTFNGTWLANPSVTAGAGANGLTVVMYVFRPSNSNSKWGVNVIPVTSSSAINPSSVTGVTTTLPNTVTMAFWGTPAVNTWGSLTGAGWSKAGITAQYRNNTTGQTHSAAYFLQAGMGATGNVGQTQTAGGATVAKIIMSWNELNDICAGPTTLTESATCSNTPGTLLWATPTAGVPGACGNANSADVWYQFTATTSYPNITLSSVGANLNAAGPRIQLLTGPCGGWTSLGCVAGTTFNTFTVVGGTGLTVGTTYYVRISTNTNTGLLTAGTYGFNICITEPNDLCANAITLTSGTSCTNIGGNVYGATLTGVVITADCASTVVYDVWYKFVAQTTNPTINLSSIGSAFANPAMELLSGACGGLSALYCGTTSISADFLVPGTTYYIRVYSSAGSAPISPANAGFNICVVDPVSPPPFNDDCANAINIPIWNTCNNVSGNMAGATLSSGVALSGPCVGTVSYDVWFKFTAVTSTASTITLSSLGTNFTSSGIQVFSGSCGSLTAVACAAGTTVTTPALTLGSVYYVRVFSTAAGPAPNGNARFNICATTTNAPVRFGNSYVNISRKTTGGVIQPGDTLEIRFTVNHTSGTMTALRYVDNVPAKTSMLTGAGDFIRIITNEGLTYKQYTLAGGDDAGTYKAAPGAGEYNIRLNVGFASGAVPGVPVDNTNTAASANGQMNAASDKPKGGGGLLFAIAYRVVVTGAVGDTVKIFPGQFIYNNGSGDVPLTATPFNILISNPLNLCANSIGLNNAVENGGTFGAGTTLNRSTDLSTPIAGYTFVPDVSPFNVVGDGRYAIMKNISPQSGIQRQARRAPNCSPPAAVPALMPADPFSCANRMFTGYWYVDGDHSGTNNAIGNNPPDATTAAGYMLIVNADYVASQVYQQTLTNLCPNTYYEFSAWVRNICPNCGIDSSGLQFTGSPTAPANGYPGVLPNLTFTLDSLDFYNTGELDTVGWQKKGFVFKTKPTQTTATFSIRNNAQGGGGNDWALDDIAIATCLPSMTYSPTVNPSVCSGNALLVNDTVNSYFNNYTYYKWQRSTDGGTNWTDITGTSNASLTFNGTTYQFITSDTIPPTMTLPADSGDLYRVIVATDTSNLGNSACLFTDASTIITLKVLNCGPPLAIDLLSFSGQNNSGYANLVWVTTNETEPVSYSIEKSTDGTHFTDIGTVNGHFSNSSDNNYYHFNDPAKLSGKTWYRLALYSNGKFKKYSRVILLSDQAADFNLTNVINPFTSQLDFEITIPENSRIDAIITNMLGRPVRRESFNVYSGINSLTIPGTDNLPPGMYILQIKNKDGLINRKVMKK